MLFHIFERISKISDDSENPDFCRSGLHYPLRMQTNRFYAKAVQFSP